MFRADIGEEIPYLHTNFVILKITERLELRILLFEPQDVLDAVGEF